MTEHIQARCGGGLYCLRVAFLSKWYTVEFPCGVVIRVNPDSKLTGKIVSGNNHLVVQQAILALDKIAVNKRSKLRAVVLGYALRDGASNQEMSWACAKMGIYTQVTRCDLADRPVIEQARAILAAKAGATI